MGRLVAAGLCAPAAHGSRLSGGASAARPPHAPPRSPQPCSPPSEFLQTQAQPGPRSDPSTCARRRPPRWPGVTDADAAPLLGPVRTGPPGFVQGECAWLNTSKLKSKLPGRRVKRTRRAEESGSPVLAATQAGPPSPLAVPGAGSVAGRTGLMEFPSVSQAQGRAPRSVRK